MRLTGQLVIVYMGVIFADKEEKSDQEHAITYSTIGVGIGEPLICGCGLCINTD
jgi:hypothetical protein